MVSCTHARSIEKALWPTALIQLCGFVARLPQGGAKEYETSIDLGCEVYCKARVPDTSHIYVHVGLGFHIECPLSEVPVAVAPKKTHLEKQIMDTDSKIEQVGSSSHMCWGVHAKMPHRLGCTMGGCIMHATCTHGWKNIKTPPVHQRSGLAGPFDARQANDMAYPALASAQLWQAGAVHVCALCRCSM